MRESDRKLRLALEEVGLTELAARAEEFNDFFGSHEAPKIALVAELRKAGASELAARVIAGEFDSGPAEAQEWRASPEAREIAQHVEG